MVRGVLGAALALLVGAPAASALNTRVEIANYRWSNPDVQIDRGEKVTWDWLGPDLAHSVTGISANDLQWDSDPGTDAPEHRAGDEFTLQFDQPGTYYFQCKLHAFVRGEVVEAWSVTGDADAIARVRTEDNAALERLIMDLQRNGLVVRTRSQVVLSRLVRRAADGL